MRYRERVGEGGDCIFFYNSSARANFCLGNQFHHPVAGVLIKEKKQSSIWTDSKAIDIYLEISNLKSYEEEKDEDSMF